MEAGGGGLRAQFTDYIIKKDHVRFQFEVTGAFGLTFMTVDRYRNIRRLWRSIKRESSQKVPPFPEKFFFGNYDEELLNLRLKALELWFNETFKDPETVALDCVRAYFEETCEEMEIPTIKVIFSKVEEVHQKKMCSVETAVSAQDLVP